MSLTVERLAYKPFAYPWAFDLWKKQQQVHWLPDEVPLNDDVIDWDQNLTPSEKHLLTQIFRFFTQSDIEVGNCFVEGTEVLTNRGFVDFRGLTDDDLVAQVNKDTLETSFVKPSRVVQQRHVGKMVSFKNKIGTVNVAVTPDHEMLFERVGTKDAGVRYKEAASSLNMTQYKAFHTASIAVGTRDALTPRDRLLIAYQADGRKREKCGGDRKPDYTMTFAFLKERKVERLRDLLAQAGYEYVEGTQDSQWGVYTTFRVKFPGGQPPFDLSWVDLSDKSASWCRDFLDEASHWDSWRDGGYVQYRSTSKSSADMMTAIRTLAGYRGKTTYNAYGYQSEHWLVAWSEDYKPVLGSLIQKETFDYDGDVYCVTVPDGNIIVRHNGAVLVCGNCYHRHYLRFIKPTEVVMMLLCFANMETVHTAAYSHLLETIGMPAAEYDAFLQYAEMKEKFDFMRSFNPDDPISVAETMAIFGGFIEGLQLFASFAMLLNFPRKNKMKGMGQIVTWSVRDETIHCEGITHLYHEWCREHGLVGNKELEARVRSGCREIVKGEDAFIDLSFELGPVDGMTPEDVKAYIRYIADIRLAMLGYAPEYGITRNPLPWLTAMLNGVEHANFFEARATEYSKAATTGDWDDGFE